jgi:hypothetical protein
MINERGLRRFEEHRDQEQIALRTERLEAMPRDCGAGGVRLHMDRASVLAGQRYLKKEYGSAAAKSARRH